MNLIERVSLFLTKFITDNNNYDSIKIIKIKYGLECILSESSKFLLYLVIFSLFSLTLEFIIATLFFSLFRIFSGGFHQSTYFSCLTTSFIILSTIILIPIIIEFTSLIISTLIIITIILTFLYSPVDHPNKPIKSIKRRKQIKAFSILILFLLIFISLLLNYNLSNIAVSALFIQSITLPLGKLKIKKT